MALTNSENSKELIQQLNEGSHDAFRKIYTFYYRGLVAFSSQYVDFEEAEEVVQEVMLWVWENRNKISYKLSLKSLLFTMVKNRSLNKIAHLDVRRRAYAEIIRESEDLATPDDFVNGSIFKKYQLLLKTMPDTYREAFELNRLKNMTHKEIADYLDVSPQTINYRISQALKFLRGGLKEFLPLLLPLILLLSFI
ncbi:RNA polymerase, sigma-24 subunit, ECF subfamily [Bacteroides coprosuis DSM 18011]|mgnify:CR=1 FL=1|uniref:RNA polymerase, sigma-24 subunit, ECF subfamily n=1 Tax=Bacteroides coprosuis DSM 18011 TaxID=679937 RepID=F3ZUK7_9BACE|nr:MULTISPECIES: RNA polymerase sigma-70 factor [Bacteroides]EGJ71172.1 RNA polymerase, sigma-24 subunit, ECF subfamily [Bacteroides coprosuis DSM 18011]